MEPGSEVPIEQIRSMAEEAENNREYSRDEVLGSFHRLFDGLKDTVPKNSLEPRNAPDEQTWGYLITESALQKSNESGTYVTEFPRSDGKNYQQTEGIPVEHLLAYASRQLDREDLSPEEKKVIATDALTLWNNSSSYLDYPSRRYDLNKIIARTKYEARLVSLDVRDTGSNDENWYKAESSLIGTSINNIQYRSDRDRTKKYQQNHSLIFQRRELVIPPSKDQVNVNLNSDITPPTLTASQENPEYRQSDFLKEIDTQQKDYKQTDFLDKADSSGSKNKDVENQEYRQSDFLSQIDEQQESYRQSDFLDKVDSPKPGEITEQKISKKESVEEDTKKESEKKQDKIPVPPISEEPKDIRFETTIVNRSSDPRIRARELAESQWNEEMRSLSGFNPLKFARRFQLRSLEEWYKQRYLQRAVKAMIENNNSCLEMDLVHNQLSNPTANRAKEQGEAHSVIEDIRSQKDSGELRADTSVLEVNGELKTKFNDSVLKPLLENISNNSEERIATMQSLLRQFIAQNQEDTTVQEIFGKEASEFNVIADYFATDLLALVDKIKEDQETHQRVLANMDQYINLQFANIQWRAQTEVNFNAADRLIQKVQGTRAGIILTPATVGLAFSLGTAALTKGRSIATHAIATPVAGFLAGATFAALRRSKDLKVDYQTHARERTYGNTIQPRSERREKLDTYMQTMASTTSLLDGGEEGRNRTESDYRGINELIEQDLSSELNRKSLLNRVAEIQERLDFSVRQKVDLITYDDEFEVQKGRLQLQLAVAHAKVKLKEAGMSEDEIVDTLRNFRADWNQKFIKDKHIQDQEFTHYRVNQAVRAGVLGGGLGAVSGLLGERLMGNINKIPGVGVVGEKIDDIHDKIFETTHMSNDGTTHIDRQTFQNAYNNPESQTLNLSDTVTAQINPDHTVVFTNGQTTFSGQLSPDGTITGTGKLPPEINQNFQDLFNVEQKTVSSDSAITEELKQLSESGKGTVSLNEHYQLSYDSGNVSSIINMDTNTPLFSSENIQISPDGKIQILDLNNLDAGTQKAFEELGFHVQSIDALNSPVNHTLFGPDTKLIEVPMGGEPGAPLIKIPEGTSWIDGQDGAHTLIVADRPDIVILPDAKIVDGQLTWDKNYSYSEFDPRIGVRTEGIFPQTSISYEGSNSMNTETKSALEELLKGRRECHWTFESTGAPPYAVHEELGLHTFMEPGVGGKNGNAIKLSMENMTITDIPGREPINVEQIVEEGRAGFVFVFKDKNGEQFSIPVPIGTDGTLLLDPNDNDPTHILNGLDGQKIQMGELSRMILNTNRIQELSSNGTLQYGDIATELNGHQDIWNPFAISAAELTENPDGSFDVRSFATIHGSDILPETVEVNAPEVQIPVINIGPLTEKLSVTELTPSSETSDIFTLTPHEIFNDMENVNTGFTFPVTPFLPRYPLENTTRVLGPDRARPDIYGHGYDRFRRSRPEMLEYYRNRRSTTLNNNPDAILDTYTEAQQYFANRELNRPEYMAQLESYMNQDNMTEAMDPNCEAVVCIPTYTLGEGQIISNTLEQYLHQIDPANSHRISPDKFEIIIFLNHPTPKREELETRLGKSYLEESESRVRNGTPEPYDTEEVIRQFKTAHPELKVRVMKQEFPERPVWGNIIKPLYDIALLRAIRRPGNDSKKDPLIITNDADAVMISPTYIKDIIESVSANNMNSRTNPSQRWDGVVGKIDMPNHGYEETPGFLAAMRLYQFMDSQNRRRDGNNQPRQGEVLTQGRNSIIKGSIYAAIGGVNTDTDAGADTELGDMISVARGRESIGYLNRAWLLSDSRRELGMWKEGTPLSRAWHKWDQMDVYGKQPEGVALEDPSRLDKDFLELEIYDEMNRWGQNVNSPILIRSLNWLGLHSKEFLQQRVDRLISEGNIINSPEFNQALAELGIDPSYYRIEGNKVIMERGDYHIENRNIKRGDYTMEGEQIVIDNIQGVIHNLNKFIAQNKAAIADEKVRDINPAYVSPRT